MAGSALHITQVTGTVMAVRYYYEYRERTVTPVDSIIIESRPH